MSRLKKLRMCNLIIIGKKEMKKGELIPLFIKGLGEFK